MWSTRQGGFEAKREVLGKSQSPRARQKDTANHAFQMAKAVLSLKLCILKTREAGHKTANRGKFNICGDVSKRLNRVRNAI